MSRWWRIVGPRFVAGLRVESTHPLVEARVVEADPILGWAVGQPWWRVREWMRRRGFHGEPLTVEGA